MNKNKWQVTPINNFLQITEKRNFETKLKNQPWNIIPRMWKGKQAALYFASAIKFTNDSEFSKSILKWFNDNKEVYWYPELKLSSNTWLKTPQYQKDPSYDFEKAVEIIMRDIIEWYLQKKDIILIYILPQFMMI